MSPPHTCTPLANMHNDNKTAFACDSASAAVVARQMSMIPCNSNDTVQSCLFLSCCRAFHQLTFLPSESDKALPVARLKSKAVAVMTYKGTPAAYRVMLSRFPTTADASSSSSSEESPTCSGPAPWGPPVPFLSSSLMTSEP